MNRTIASLLLLAGAAFSAGPPTIAQLYDGPVKNAEGEIVSLAEAMPAEKYGFAPTDGAFTGVRTFAQQMKHIAAVVYMVSAAAMKEKPPVELGGENGPDTVATKEQIVKFLKDSFAYAHKAAQSLTDKNQLEMVKSPFGEGQVTRGSAVEIVGWHSFDHYGQMVVYARMNGVVPPASR